MADSKIKFSDGSAAINVKAIDLGDGTFALAVDTASSGSTPITVGGQQATVAAELTRTADVNAYAANDVVSNSVSATTLVALAGVGRANGGTGYIVGARLATNKTGVLARFRVHLYSVNVGMTLAVDNAAWEDLYADIASATPPAKEIGYFDLPALFTSANASSDNSHIRDFTQRFPFQCASGDSALYYALETLDGFTPASAQKFMLELKLDRN